MPVDPKTGKEYPYTEEGIAEHKKDTGGMPMKNSGFKMRSGNVTPFKEMGSSPVKQDYVSNIYDAKWNPSGNVDFSGKPYGKFKQVNPVNPTVRTATTTLKTQKNLIKKPILSKIKEVGSKILKNVPKALKVATGVAEAKFTYDLAKHGIKNIKEGKAIIPKGHYQKGGEGYKKQDYSKSFDYSGKKK